MAAVRNPRLAKVQIARKELALDDGAYRTMLERLTGKRSAGDCSDEELDAVLDELKAKGWKPKVIAGSAAPRQARSAPGRRGADHPVARKARAMWISLHQLGVVRNRGDAALEAFARRQLGVEVFQWADQAQGYKLVEALKAMAERAGWSQDVAGVPASQQTAVLKKRLADLLEARA